MCFNTAPLLLLLPAPVACSHCLRPLPVPERNQPTDPKSRGPQAGPRPVLGPFRRAFLTISTLAVASSKKRGDSNQGDSMLHRFVCAAVAFCALTTQSAAAG